MSAMGITADAALRSDDCATSVCLSTMLVKPKEEEQLAENRLDTRLHAFRPETKCDTSSRSSIPATTTSTSTRVSSPLVMVTSGTAQNSTIRTPDPGNSLRSASREPCLTPQLNYIPPGLHCRVGETGDYLEVCASGRFAAGHVWGPYLTHLTAECRQRLRMADEHNPNSVFSIAVKNDGTVADANAIVLGEEHTWIKLLYESGLRGASGQEANLDLLVDPTSKTITLVVTTEIKANDPLRGSLRIRTAHPTSPNQQNDSNTGALSSLGSGNGPTNLKPVLQISPGSHASSSSGSTGVTSLGPVGASPVTGVTGTTGASVPVGVGGGPKRDKKCTYCGIPFSNLDTLNAHMTHYCSRRPQLLHNATHSSGGVSSSGPITITGGTSGAGGVGVDPGGTTAAVLGKSVSSSSGLRLNGSKRPVSRNGSVSLPTTTDPTLLPGLSSYAGQIPLFSGTSFDKLHALSTLASTVPLTDSLAPHMDYTDLSTALFHSVLPGPFLPGPAGGSCPAVTTCGGTGVGGGPDAAATIRASLAATMLPYLTRLLPTATTGTVCAPAVSTPAGLRSEVPAAQTTKQSEANPVPTAVLSKSIPTSSHNPSIDLDHGEKRTSSSGRSFIPTESSQSNLCNTPPLSEHLVPSLLYCNGCQRFFASGYLFSCHLQMSYRLLKSTDHEAASTASAAESADRETGSALQLATAASQLGLVLAAPLVTTNGVHYVPVHPSCGTQFEPNSRSSGTNLHPHSSALNHSSTNTHSQQSPITCRTPKHSSPGSHSTKGARDAALSSDQDINQFKGEGLNLPITGKLSSTRPAPSKILDLSCSPHGMGAFTNLNRDTSQPSSTHAVEQPAPAETPSSTRLTIPNGTSSSSQTGNAVFVPSLEYSPYSNLFQLFTQLMTGTPDQTEPEVTGTVNLPQLMAQLYSAAGLYGPLAASMTSVASSCFPAVTNTTSTSLSSTLPIPLFAPFWLASHNDDPLSGLASAARITTATTPGITHTPPNSPIRDPKPVPNPMELLASVYPTPAPGHSVIPGRSDLINLGKSGKGSGSVHPNAVVGHVPLHQTSPTRSPESPNCRPFLCTYCQTRFQAYTTYIAHQDIYCQARREALKNMRVQPSVTSSSSNSAPAAPVTTGSSSPTGSISNKRRRIQSPGPTACASDSSKSHDNNPSTRFSLSSPNASSASGGSGDDDPEACSPSGVKPEPGIRRARLDDSISLGTGLAAIEAESSSCSSSGPQWEVCRSSELRCSACGYVGQTARGMKMHKRLHDCNGTASR